MTPALQNTVEMLDELIAFETVSSQSNKDCIDWIADRLSGLGAVCEISSDTPGKANIFATLGPDIDGGIILSGHSDVVPVEGQNWSSDPFKMTRVDDRLFGRGTCDMKGFIAACLAYAPHVARDQLRKPLHFAFTHDEETGCLGAQVMIKELLATGRKPSIAIIGEPTSMRIIEGHKGCCEYTTEFHGVEGHSSRPELGVNALDYAVRFILKMTELRAKFPSMAPEGSRFEPPHSTSSVGALNSGIAHNVIPNHAAVKWEVRPVQMSDHDWFKSELDHYIDTVLRPEMQSKSPHADIVETLACIVEGLEPDPDSAAVDLIRKLTGSNATDLVAFGTEAGLFQKVGISSVICGPGSIEQAHKPDEYIELGELQKCLDMFDRLSERLI